MPLFLRRNFDERTEPFWAAVDDQPWNAPGPIRELLRGRPTVLDPADRAAAIAWARARPELTD